MKFLYSILFLFVFAACDQANEGRSNNRKSQSRRESFNKSSSTYSSDENDNEYTNGAWCADVEYYNPNTGTRHTYNLDVEVENGELVQINWPNGGGLDESHFSGEDISSGECSFRSDKGYRYTVTLNDKGSCGYDDSHKMRRDVEEDNEEQEKQDEETQADDKDFDDIGKDN